MTDLNLTELKRLAEAATPGEWSVEPHGQTHALYAGRTPARHGLRILNLDDGDQNFRANAAFVAAANPATILSLIKRVEEAEALRDVVESYAREEAEVRAVIPAHCQLDLPDGGDVKLHEAITRCAAEAHARGVAEGLERAAKMAEGVDPVSGERGQAWVAHSLYDNMRKHVAAAIRKGE